MNQIKIRPKTLIFNEKARLACISCKNYGLKATCPPYLSNTDYFKKALRTYKNGIIYYEKFETTKENWKQLRETSSLKIHKYILEERKKLIETGHYYYITLGAGSCKLCSSCSFPCKKPSESLIPIEGTGVDLVETLKQYKIKISFPIKDYFYRFGLLLWD